jgi:hypothetical protein
LTFCICSLSSILWRWHLWYFNTMPTYMYHCWHCKWCHSLSHHLLNPCLCALLFFLKLWSWGSTFFNFVFPFENTLQKFCYTIFHLFSNATCISSLVLLTLVCGLCGFVLLVNK